MDKTTVYLPTELHFEVRAIARRTGRPQAVVIREAIQEYVDRQDEPELLSLGIAENAGLDGADVEDWLKANWRPDADWGREIDPRSEPGRQPE